MSLNVKTIVIICGYAWPEKALGYRALTVAGQTAHVPFCIEPSTPRACVLRSQRKNAIFRGNVKMATRNSK